MTTVMMPGGGVVIPWPTTMPIDSTTWSVKLGMFPSTEKIVLEICYDYGIQEHVSWAQEHWDPLFGITYPTHGAREKVDRLFHGGPCIVRGVISPGAALRVRITTGTGFEIPIHAQLGNTSYVGVISTEQTNNFVIHEEMTVEDLLNP